MSRKSIRIAGFGGQGVITMGYVLANAASIHDNSYALMTQSYGPAARGGSCKADIVISDSPIDYPKSDEVDVLVALSNDSYSSFRSDVKKGGVVIYEKSLVELGSKTPDITYIGIAAVEKANELGNPLAANMVMLGAVQAITGITGVEALRSSITERFSRYVEINQMALKEGYKLGKDSLGKNPVVFLQSV